MHIIFPSLPPALTELLIIVDEPYLDPGSGSYIIQLIIASLLGAAFIVRASWSKIKTFFKSTFNNSEDEADIPEENGE
jgi:hypothetical protein